MNLTLRSPDAATGLLLVAAAAVLVVGMVRARLGRGNRIA